jgi:uncharacterized protein YegL
MVLLAEVLCSDLAQLEADAMSYFPPTVMVVADGLPTDSYKALLDGIKKLRYSVPTALCLHVLCAADADVLAFRGMGFKRVLSARSDEDPSAFAAQMVEALSCKGLCQETI